MTNKFDRIHTNTNKKYIIRNCPRLEQSDIDKDIYNSCLGATDHIGMCRDCTDCVMKQVVELCKHYKEHSDCGRECPSFGMFLSKLLGKLDIQEVK